MKIELGNKILAKYYSDYLYLAIFTFIYSMIFKFHQISERSLFVSTELGEAKWSVYICLFRRLK